MPATDGNSLENGDILKCHLCRHRVWGTWPFMQAHYREDHGYWPGSWLPVAAQPQREHDEHTPQEGDPPPLQAHEPKTQQNRGTTNQTDTGVDDKHEACNPQTEKPHPPHTPRVKTHGERKLIYHENIEPGETTYIDTHRTSKTTQLYKSVKTTEAWLNKQTFTEHDKGIPEKIQRLGSLNFPPLNPGNSTLIPASSFANTNPGHVIQAYHKENEGQPAANASAASTPTPDLGELRIAPRKTSPKQIITLAVEDMAVNMQRGKQIIFAANDNHKANQNAAPHQPPTENNGETYTDLSYRTYDHTFEGPRADGDRELYEATNGYIPHRISEQTHTTTQLLALGDAAYGDRSPQREPRTEVDHDVHAETGTTSDAEKAIISAILLGKVDATGSYNVNGHAASIEDLQEQLRNLRDRN